MRSGPSINAPSVRGRAELRRVMWSKDSAHNVAHNAGSQRSRNSPNLRALRLHVVSWSLCTYQILYLAGLTKASEFHLYSYV